MPRQLANINGSWTYREISITVGGGISQVQFNDSDTFGGNTALTFNKTTGVLTSTAISASALTGSLTKLTDGSSYLLASTNISLATGSGGAVTITSTGISSISSIVSASYVSSSQSTTSTSYTDLATVGPAVTLTTGTSVVCHVYSRVVPSTSAGSPRMGVAVSGATTVAAADAIGANGGGSVTVATPVSGSSYNMNGSLIFTGLTAGSNTFTLKYRTDNVSYTENFADRAIVVQRLN